MAALVEKNKGLLDEEEMKLCTSLATELGQAHLFENWGDDSKEAEELKKAQVKALMTCDKSYPDGLKSYISKAKVLLKASLEGANPFEGWVPSIPAGERLKWGNDRFSALEDLGLKEVEACGFVLVAGGLGERLGYNGIKVSLPIETTSMMCFLQYYIRNILEFQRRARLRTKREITLPFAIMTSGDTHEKTVALLKANKNFGMADGQITLMQQEKVPALETNDAKIAMKGKIGIQTKPHGHGDVHVLMHQSGTAAKWVKDHKTRWILFFQDTNAMSMRALPAALGVSKEKNFAMNSITVPRKPGQAMGGIATLTKGDQKLTVNVEYNQLGPLLTSTGDKKGDVADESGFSPYPGNCNTFVLKADTYVKILEKSNGLMPEFVNPKYKDAEKTQFKKPTRLECMMQDYPRLLTKDQPAGMTQCERFYAMEPVKNNIVDAAKKQEASGCADSAASGEFEVYRTNRRYLSAAGVEFEDDAEKVYSKIKVPYNSRVTVQPSFAQTLRQYKDHIKGKVKVSAGSSLILDGDIDIMNLTLDGALEIKAGPGAKVTVKNLTVKNNGWEFAEVDPSDEKVEEQFRIRGYQPNRLEEVKLSFPVQGQYVVDDTTSLRTGLPGSSKIRETTKSRGVLALESPDLGLSNGRSIPKRGSTDKKEPSCGIFCSPAAR